MLTWQTGRPNTSRLHKRLCCKHCPLPSNSDRQISQSLDNACILRAYYQHKTGNKKQNELVFFPWLYLVLKAVGKQVPGRHGLRLVGNWGAELGEVPSRCSPHPHSPPPLFWNTLLLTISPLLGPEGGITWWEKEGNMLREHLSHSLPFLREDFGHFRDRVSLKCKTVKKWLGSSVPGRMGIAWGLEMWTPTLAYWCLSNCNQIVPSPFLLAGFMCLGIKIKLYNLVWMSAVDEKQIPAGTARTLHSGCVWGTWAELCGRGSAEFIAQVQLGLLLLCNFSRSHLIYLGMWLHSALRNTSLSTVTLTLLFSHVKNKEEKNPAFIGRAFCLCPLSPRDYIHTYLPAPEHGGCFNTYSGCTCLEISLTRSCKCCWNICPLVQGSHPLA